MRLLMPCPRANRRGTAAGANHRACTTSVAIWYGAKIGSFGVYRTYAAVAPEARFVPEPFAWRLPEGPSRKRGVKKLKAERACRPWQRSNRPHSLGEWSPARRAATHRRRAIYGSATVLLRRLLLQAVRWRAAVYARCREWRGSRADRAPQC